MKKNSSEIKKKGIYKYKKLKILEIKNLIEKLSNFYEDDLNFLLNYSFYLSNSNKLYIFNGSLDEIDLTKINTLGIYFGTFHNKDRFRLSIEGSKFVKPKKNFVKLNEKSFKSYITAENLFKEEVEKISKENNCPFQIVIYENENLGSVSIKENEILTYVPKSRKLDFNRVF